MSKLEKQISKDVKNALSALESDGAVLWHERLNSGKVRTEYGSWLQLCRKGTADFIALLPIENGILPYFIETKSDKGCQSLAQIEFQKKIESVGCFYEVVHDTKQVKLTIERITNFYSRKLKDIKFQ